MFDDLTAGSCEVAGAPGVRRLGVAPDRWLDTARRLAEAMPTAVAPAALNLAVSLPSRSNWNSCASCLSAATRTPRALRREIRAVSAVVLPLPE
jgi:hypothetical protein